MDSQSGLAHSAVVTAANVHDKHPLPDLLHGQERRVYGDSAYASQKALIGAKAPKAKDFTNQRTRRKGVVDEALKAKNRNKSRIRSRVGLSRPMKPSFWESFKGQRKLPRPARKRAGVGANWERIAVLVVRDRSGQTADFRLDKIDAPHVTAVLRPLVDKDAILCTDGTRVYQTVARAMDLTHRAINVQQGVRVIDGAFHIQNVNAYDGRLKEWIGRFHGVATKYLENYLGWRRMMERHRQNISPTACLYEALGRFPSQQLTHT